MFFEMVYEPIELIAVNYKNGSEAGQGADCNPWRWYTKD